MDLSRRNDAIVAVFPVHHRDQVMLVSNAGTVIRLPVNDIRIARRRTQGVVVFKPGEGERVVSAARLGETGEENGNGENGAGGAENGGGT
jgi:DNA gyrase subunit A